MTLDEASLRQQMAAVVDRFREEITSIRTGRANPDLIGGVLVDVYGGSQRLRLRELGTILVEGPRMLVFEPWDKTIIGEVKNALAQANLGFMPQLDGDRLRLQLPELTGEQRQKYLRLLGEKLEAARVKIRQLRAEVRRQLQEEKRAGSISEDEYYRQEEQLQKLTDEHIQQLEQLAARKEEELKIE